MAQADQTVQNATFPTVRADINNNLAALFSNNSGSIEPLVNTPGHPPAVAYMDWIDTSGTDPVWKKRNAANNAWITIGTIDGNDIAFEGTLPDQSGESGKFLTTDGTNATWLAIPPGSTSQTFTSSGTWTKPASGNLVYVELWGGGGGGPWANNGGGGGGGAFRWALIPMAALSASESVTVGSGGAGAASAGNGFDGGSSSFAGIIAGGGGYGRFSTSKGGGGGGGWQLSATGGATGVGGAGYLEFGEGMTSGSTNISLWVGAGGADFDSAKGADSVFGGAGGGGRNSTAVKPGGTSVFGGDGGSSGGASGNPGGNGSIPGGGGGAATGAAGGNGGRGEVRIYVW